jgi:hypothetical protein
MRRLLWNVSAASLLGRKSKAWRDIRSAALPAAEDTCSADGEVTPGASSWCDELWSYSDTDGVAVLTGLRILCPPCDHARHFARAGQLGQAVAVLSTLARVNGISEEGARAPRRGW